MSKHELDQQPTPDIGVLLTKGWDHEASKLAAAHFHLDLTETEVRHHLMFDNYEEGKLMLATEFNEMVNLHSGDRFQRPRWGRAFPILALSMRADRSRK